MESKLQSPVLPPKLIKNDIVSFSNAAELKGVMIYTPFFIEGVLGIHTIGSALFKMPIKKVGAVLLVAHKTRFESIGVLNY